MRCAFAIVPLVAVAYAQSAESSASAASSSTSTYTYSNPNTQYLTETNSLGVVTGQPSNAGVAATSQPAVATSQPELATIPAGLPSGVHTIFIGNTSSFLINVGSSTTSVLAGGAVATDATLVTSGTAATADASSTGSAGSGSHSSGTSTTPVSGTRTGASASATTTSAAGATFKVATAGSLLGLGALFAALL